MNEIQKSVTKAEAQKVSLTQLAMQKSEKLLKNLGVQSTTARRLIYAMITKGEEALAKGNREWKDIKQADFVQKLVVNACAGLDAQAGDLYVYPWREESNGPTVMIVAKTSLGWQKVMHKYGPRKPINVRAHALYEGDVFDYEETSEGTQFKYKKSLKKDKGAKLIGAFAFIKYTDGGDDFLYWTTDDINARREQGKKMRNQKDSPAWINWEGEVVESKILRTLIEDRVPLDIPSELTELMEKDSEKVSEDAQPKIPMKYDVTAFDAEYEEVTEPAEEEQKEPEKAETAKEEPKQDKPKQQKMV